MSTVEDRKQIIVKFISIYIYRELLALYLPLISRGLIVSKRPCKIQCTFYCHRVAKIIAPLFVYVGPPPLGSK